VIEVVVGVYFLPVLGLEGVVSMGIATKMIIMMEVAMEIKIILAAERTNMGAVIIAMLVTGI
jgi:hypothetical protein